ncbi:unnamed protein product [Enterobius vermicularis]|uniref:AB hydrolase-1 domain-containing protein n=1 Tax=Enterobius vermicularis TaxID=51028 RepID=A0A0N4V8B4_ENTVE|nr:unnamed protein product [Enterobius vermicularis]
MLLSVVNAKVRAQGSTFNCLVYKIAKCESSEDKRGERGIMGLRNLALNYMIGPRLYAVYSQEASRYKLNSMESISDLIHVCTTVFPLLVVYAYRNSLVNLSFVRSCTEVVIAYYSVAYGFRFIGRVSNPEYRNFSRGLIRQNSEPKKSDTDALLTKYDYEIFASPLAFQAKSLKRHYVSLKETDMPPEVPCYLRPIRDFVAYLCANTFGRRMVYPGSTALVQFLFSSLLLENRRKLILRQSGRRNVISTTDKNRIDTVFFDRRGEGEKGSTLVITCEGNAAFYETGIMSTPLSLGYSVLGWNAPGFAESSGQPTPSQILCAMDAVMQLALEKLGFEENQVIIYAWSIGGFPATWAAMNFPKIQGLMLDATFDDLLPLALARMPDSLSPLVHYTIRKHLNLPVAAQLSCYKGPVVLIRRRRDELLATLEHGSDEEKLLSNRTNELLKLQQLSGLKFSNLDHELYVDMWLASNADERSQLEDQVDKWQGPVPNSVEHLNDERRISLIFHLCSWYFIDFNSEHNTPLDPTLFSLPVAL